MSLLEQSLNQTQTRIEDRGIKIKEKLISPFWYYLYKFWFWISVPSLIIIIIVTIFYILPYVSLFSDLFHKIVQFLIDNQQTINEAIDKASILLNSKQ